MHTPPRPATSFSPLSPTRGRLILIAALALAAFFVPQTVPLEWYPLSQPGPDILYLEITCAANKPGTVQIFYDTTHGIRELDSIRFPISPTDQAYTYTFPLPDAPITGWRFDPVEKGGTLTIRQMRIIDHRGVEMRRFTWDMFKAGAGVAAINPAPDGWSITSVKNSTDPYCAIQLDAPILAKDLNHRNFLRCLYSTSYLALMLWILLLAALFAFYRPHSWRDIGSHLAFMTAIALMFSAVGNRGLIKNSARYARFQPPMVADIFYLEMELSVQRATAGQVLWDIGAGYNEKDSAWMDYDNDEALLQVIRFPLPARPLQALRYDPLIAGGRLAIRSIRVTDVARRTRAELPLDSFEVLREVNPLRVEQERLIVEVPTGRTDPILQFKPAGLAAINRALPAGPKP